MLKQLIMTALPHPLLVIKNPAQDHVIMLMALDLCRIIMRKRLCCCASVVMFAGSQVMNLHFHREEISQMIYYIFRIGFYACSLIDL